MSRDAIGPGRSTADHRVDPGEAPARLGPVAEALIIRRRIGPEGANALPTPAPVRVAAADVRRISTALDLAAATARVAVNRATTALVAAAPLASGRTRRARGAKRSRPNRRAHPGRGVATEGRGPRRARGGARGSRRRRGPGSGPDRGRGGRSGRGRGRAMKTTSAVVRLRDAHREASGSRDAPTSVLKWAAGSLAGTATRGERGRATAAPGTLLRRAHIPRGRLRTSPLSSRRTPRW